MALQSIFCRHTWYWSERHGSERCRQCGKLSDGEIAPAASTEAFAPPPVTAPPARPFQLAAQIHARTLFERLDMLADGGDLTRDEVLQTVVELIEDGQTARPRLTSDVAARYFAALAGARGLHA
ncbi:MAG: hypothetical protein KJ676_11100 [Alphaproteobacteria bacterium]|nr:hypothetical protein [Alphaproteobacteria bacterium]MBU1525570.1 hypothetical protein [Alphaproteobacteria bacterium]MBU2116221.1 hypothetical protein [Alphaproteobacteria bacterium]MBU2350505.1 hypothetical protein [Alphaproteobacteria bacterium]MBU2381502.1 hypothetical protein [Alphaproteobacteria bacterium]